MQRIFKLIAVLVMLAIVAPLANAMSAYLYNFNNTYPAAAATLGQNCTLCHAIPEGGGPPNPYGADYAAFGYSFSDIEQLDSDNDGYTNIQEIQALTYPGDPTSHPDLIGAPVSGPLPLTVSFTAVPANSPTSWSWDFGDGSTSTLQDPVHTYTASGSYTVSLTIGTGAAVQITKNAYINVGACGYPPVKIGGISSYNDSIQNTYNVITNNETIQMQALEFTENLTLDRPVNAVIQGGYGCDFMSNPAFTTIHGSLTISGGTVTLDKLIIK